MIKIILYKNIVQKYIFLRTDKVELRGCH